MDKSKVLGVPLVLIAHAVILTVLLGLVMFVLLVRLVTVPLLGVDARLHKLEVDKPVTLAPTATPAATLTPVPAMTKTQIRPVPTQPVVPVITGTKQ